MERGGYLLHVNSQNSDALCKEEGICVRKHLFIAKERKKN
jgi:hypothetical protein